MRSCAVNADDGGLIISFDMKGHVLQDGYFLKGFMYMIHGQYHVKFLHTRCFQRYFSVYRAKGKLSNSLDKKAGNCAGMIDILSAKGI